MARITSQKAAVAAGGHFRLVLVAAQRARQLDKPTMLGDKTAEGIVLRALRDVEAGNYGWEDYIRDRK
jgi:DNA-directed RNA polymerase omega subunit